MQNRKNRLRYVADEETYKDDAYLALVSHFDSRDEFERFYSSLGAPALRDEFLRAATFYLFFVRRGDWHVSIERSNPVISYITNSFKIVTLFSLIESLSDKQHIDFYKWLCNEAGGPDFPIADRTALSNLDAKHKEEYGSICRRKSFFLESACTESENTV